MGILEDTVKILERIPVWKRLVRLPDEIEALTQRVANLEAELKKRPPIESCPLCNTGTLKVIAVTPHNTFGDLGIQERRLKCDNATCGHTEKRIHDPEGRIKKK